MYMYIVSVSRLYVRITIAFVVLFFNWSTGRSRCGRGRASKRISLQKESINLVIWTLVVGRYDVTKKENKKVDWELILVGGF